jgi:hypothetical protein
MEKQMFTEIVPALSQQMGHTTMTTRTTKTTHHGQ